MRPLLVLLLTLPVPAQAAGLCVTNASALRHFFAITADDGGRVVDWLAPGARLCLDSPTAGTASVYEEQDALEGCSRRLPPGGEEEMHAYARFDRCTWSAHLD